MRRRQWLAAACALVTAPVAVLRGEPIAPEPISVFRWTEETNAPANAVRACRSCRLFVDTPDRIWGRPLAEDLIQLQDAENRDVAGKIDAMFLGTGLDP